MFAGLVLVLIARARLPLEAVADMVWECVNNAKAGLVGGDRENIISKPWRVVYRNNARM